MNDAKDGRTVIRLVSVELIEINGEHCVLGVVADITDRKQAEQALAESERRFRLMANTAPVLIWTSGLDKLGNYFNQPWLDFTGRSKAQELGNGWTEGIHPDDVATTVTSVLLRRRRASPCSFGCDGMTANTAGCSMRRASVPGTVPLPDTWAPALTSATRRRRRLPRRTHWAADPGRGRRAKSGRARVARRHQPEDGAAGQRPPGAESICVRDLVRQTSQLRELWQLTNEIATDIEHMSHQLHPSKLHYLGLASAVRDLCRESSRQYKIEIDCVVRELPRGPR